MEFYIGINIEGKLMKIMSRSDRSLGEWELLVGIVRREIIIVK